MATSFSVVYDRFLGKITDDMYMEWTKEDTEKDMKNILIEAIPGFEFPLFSLYDYDADSETYNVDLTSEEVNILALLMVENWLQRQITSIENTRMKYTGSDYKLTSQANHLSKLVALQESFWKQIVHKQRLYKRHKDTSGSGDYKSNWAMIMESSALG